MSLFGSCRPRFACFSPATSGSFLPSAYLSTLTIALPAFIKAQRSMRTRSSRSKYFQTSDDDSNQEESDTDDKDSDFEILTDEDDVGKTSKSRKRKSTTKKSDEGKQKRKRNTPNKDLKGKSKKVTAKAAANKADINNNGPNENRASTSKFSEDDTDDDSDDWEEVEDADVFDLDDYKPSLPNNIKITVQKPKKEKKSDAWLEAYIRQEINRIRRMIQLSTHKCHLLILIARLQYLNTLANKSVIRALALSIVDEKLKKLKSDTPAKFMPKLFQWLNSRFELNVDKNKIDTNLYFNTLMSFESKSVTSPFVVLVILIAILRNFNFPTRLCYQLNPVPIKPTDLISDNPKKSNKNSESDSNTSTNADKRENEEVDNWQYNCHWIEVFDESKQKWDCFDFINDIHNDAYTISSQLDKDIGYVLAIDVDGFCQEVTARYAPDWVSYAFKKRRVDDGWWEETLKMLQKPIKSKYEDADAREFDEMLSKVQLPKRILDYKNHPLFVLERDILKYQALYPPNAPTLGFFRDKPVYARDCVQTLRSRETWLKTARSVKANETAYKVVTSTFKLDKASRIEGKKAMLELFGEWQTEPYVAEEVRDGIIPRNSYGNVDLYQKCMLPKGTVHLNFPGLGRIAAKLNIDCVPAVVGFDCNKHGWGARPLIEGFVVCSEYQDVLLDAWRQEQAIERDKQKKKREKRVYDNWKRLIKGLIIRQNLKIKYG